jgi:hypothetical protein
MLRKPTCLKIVVTAALLITSGPASHAQASIIYKVILAGVTILTTSSAAEAYAYRDTHPKAKVERLRPPPEPNDDDDDDQ